MNALIVRNARVVLAEQVVSADVLLQDGLIRSIDDPSVRSASTAASVDFDGDYLMPGLVELHTDNVERHFLPRPKAYWPDGVGAVMAHDNDVVCAGITTVFDSLCVGAYSGSNDRRHLFSAMDDALQTGRDSGLFRAEHLIHYRCELTDPELMGLLEPLVDRPELRLISLMDHTPGQRQWSDIDVLREFYKRTGKSAEEIEAAIALRIEIGSTHVPENRRHVAERFRGRQGTVVFASHDDTTVEHVKEAAQQGVTISEFPCTLEAARVASEHDMRVVGGAPNLVRGGSHSGNVAIAQLATEHLLDALSSDYVPASLLQAVFKLCATEAQRAGNSVDDQLPYCAALVSKNPASMVGLDDRGEIAVGKRADLIRVHRFQDTPIVRSVFSRGRQVH